MCITDTVLGVFKACEALMYICARNLLFWQQLHVLGAFKACEALMYICARPPVFKGRGSAVSPGCRAYLSSHCATNCVRFVAHVQLGPREPNVSLYAFTGSRGPNNYTF